MQLNSTEDGMYHQYPISPFLIPAGLAIGTVRYTTLSAAYAGSLITPLVMLFLFCPKTFKRSIIFPILIINLFLGISLAVLTFIESMQSLHHPIQTLNLGLTLAITCLSMLIPILTDTVLVFKLLRLFPAFEYTTVQRIMIIAVPTTLIVPRLVVMALFMQVHKQTITNSFSLLQDIRILIKSRLPLAEFSMQLASNAYCSVILLIKSYTLLYGGGGGEIPQNATETETFRSELMMNKLRLMLKIMAGSFLLPVCVQIGLVCVYARSIDFNVREPIQWTNIFISLHCAVLATVWSSIGGDTSGGGGGGEGIAEERNTKNIKKRSSSLFIPVIDHDKVGKLPNLQLITKREIIPKPSASTINESDSVEIMPGPYLLTKHNSATHSRSTEFQLQRPIYHSNSRAHQNSLREIHPTHRLPQPWNENGRCDHLPRKHYYDINRD